MPWRVLIIVGLLGALSISAGADLDWQSYTERHAIIVMGGHQPSGQLYIWYWGDTHGMYLELRDLGFTDENIYFLSYGDSADACPEHVDGVSTTDNVRAAYQWARDECASGDLLYVFWVDHGTPTYFNTYDGVMTHVELGTLTQPIVAEAIIGAYNPCYSGAVIDDVSRPGVITVTSQDASHPNSWGWAGNWRRALRGAPGDGVDTNGDGHISMTEAYEWICPRSQDAGEHSTYDDNGDGAGHECDDAGFDPTDPEYDGHFGTCYALDGWAEEASAIEITERPVQPGTRLMPAVPNPFFGTTTVRFALDGEDRVILQAYTIDGRRVTTLYDGRTCGGIHAFSWRGVGDDGRKLTPGVYYLRLLTSREESTRRLCLLR